MPRSLHSIDTAHAIHIRLIVEPNTQADPKLKTQRQYTNLSAAEVRMALIERGYREAELPSERTLRDILDRMNYRLKRIQKGKPADIPRSLASKGVIRLE